MEMLLINKGADVANFMDYRLIERRNHVMYLFIYPSIHVFIYVWIYLCIYLFTCHSHESQARSPNNAYTYDSFGTNIYMGVD